MRRCPISKTLEKVEKGEKGGKRAEKEVPVIRRNSGQTPVARGGSGAEAPPLAARPVAGHFRQKSH